MRSQGKTLQTLLCVIALCERRKSSGIHAEAVVFSAVGRLDVLVRCSDRKRLRGLLEFSSSGCSLQQHVVSGKSLSTLCTFSVCMLYLLLQ
jgi:hypothetical protein